MEARILRAFASCGSKAVAWGECGLDYTRRGWGLVHEYRQEQRDVFARQLRLAVAKGWPLVLHVRGATDATEDALSVLRQLVPRDWKAHVHSFLGNAEIVQDIIAEWPNFYFGLTGTVTMGGDGEQMCNSVP